MFRRDFLKSLSAIPFVTRIIGEQPETQPPMAQIENPTGFNIPPGSTVQINRSFLALCVEANGRIDCGDYIRASNRYRAEATACHDPKCLGVAAKSANDGELVTLYLFQPG